MPSRIYALSSTALVGLLAMTTLYYVVAGRVSEALDSVTWYVLLILFLVEAFKVPFVQSPRAIQAMRIVRALATSVLVVTLILYVRERQWIDAINLTLWLSVVALIEFELRWPDTGARRRALNAWIAGGLYAGLALIVVIWLFQKKWIDAWDAVLWISAFGMLELNLLAGDSETAPPI